MATGAVSRVLVVDDEAPIRRAMRANLEARGYDVDLAATGEQALQLAARHHPDVVLLDLGLPGMDGLAVIDGLRGWTQVPIVVLSARGSERDKVAALDAGADDYVSKPFGMDELLARLRGALSAGPPSPRRRRRSSPSTSRSTWRPNGCSTPPASRAPDADRVAAARGARAAPGQARHPTPAAAGRVGPGYGDESNYLRVHMAHLRRKLEPDRARPRYFITEPGMGYRFVLTPSPSDRCFVHASVSCRAPLAKHSDAEALGWVGVSPSGGEVGRSRCG